MLKRAAAVGFIFVCASLAWGVGATVFSRTYSSRGRLGGRVASTWGARQGQAPPAACYDEVRVKETAAIEEGRKTARAAEEHVSIPLPLESSRVEVSLDLEPRRKGLLWYSTYKVSFAGTYVFRNTSGKPQTVAFTLPFPSARI